MQSGHHLWLKSLFDLVWRWVLIILLFLLVGTWFWWALWQYFCIAPGSRSSPLAISASAHQLTTCISCYDERSLAYHAVGYARGSLRPAVVITSSGTAVSNLLPAVGRVNCIPFFIHCYATKVQFFITAGKNVYSVVRFLAGPFPTW